MCFEKKTVSNTTNKNLCKLLCVYYDIRHLFLEITTRIVKCYKLILWQHFSRVYTVELIIKNAEYNFGASMSNPDSHFLRRKHTLFRETKELISRF